MGAALLLFVSRQAVEKLGGGARSALWDPLLAFCSVLVASAAAGFFTPLTPTLLLTFFGEALLTGCLTVLLRRAGVVLAGKAKPVLTAPPDAVSVLLALGIELVFFSRVRIGSLDLAFLLAEALLPVFAFTAGPYAARCGAFGRAAAIWFSRCRWRAFWCAPPRRSAGPPPPPQMPSRSSCFCF